MFNKMIKCSILGAGLLIAGAVTAPSSASASSLDYGIYVGTSTMPRYERAEYTLGSKYYKVRGKRKLRRKCSPKRAIKKSRRIFGLRKAWVKRVGRDRIVIKGRKWGKSTRIVFARNSPHCAILKAR